MPVLRGGRGRRLDGRRDGVSSVDAVMDLTVSNEYPLRDGLQDVLRRCNDHVYGSLEMARALPQPYAESLVADNEHVLIPLLQALEVAGQNVSEAVRRLSLLADVARKEMELKLARDRAGLSSGE